METIPLEICMKIFCFLDHHHLAVSQQGQWLIILMITPSSFLCFCVSDYNQLEFRWNIVIRSESQLGFFNWLYIIVGYLVVPSWKHRDSDKRFLRASELIWLIKYLSELNRDEIGPYLFFLSYIMNLTKGLQSKLWIWQIVLQLVGNGSSWPQTMLYGQSSLRRDGEKTVLPFMLLMVQNRGKKYTRCKIVVIELDCKLFSLLCIT